MHKERFEERKSEVTRSVGRLTLVCQMTESEVIRDATIQRFEFTFEVVWKALKQYLEHQGLVCGGPRPTLRQAFSEGLIGSPEEADGWFQMVEDRNLSSHAYDEATAKAIDRRIVSEHLPRLVAMSRVVEGLTWDETLG